MALIPSPLRCLRPEGGLQSSRPNRRQRLVFALLMPLLLAACSGDSGPEVQNLPPALPSAAQSQAGAPAPAAMDSKAGAAAQQGVGLTALPSPAAVLGSLPVGRPDPFAATAMGGGQGADGSQAGLPDGFRFSGVIRSQGQAQALLQVGGQSGSVCVGARGACPGSAQAPLLPEGWSVAAIDVSNGCLTLVQAGQRQRRCLS